MRTITIHIEEEVFKIIKNSAVIRNMAGGLNTSASDILTKRILQGIYEDKKEITIKQKGS